jgi:chitinase
MEDLVILTGSHRDPEEQNVSYRWAQVSGPSVSLSGADKPEAAFIAPTVSADKTLIFSLTVTDSAGGSTTDFVTVSVHRF